LPSARAGWLRPERARWAEPRLRPLPRFPGSWRRKPPTTDWPADRAATARLIRKEPKPPSPETRRRRRVGSCSFWNIRTKSKFFHSNGSAATRKRLLLMDARQGRQGSQYKCIGEWGWAALRRWNQKPQEKIRLTAPSRLEVKAMPANRAPGGRTRARHPRSIRQPLGRRELLTASRSPPV